MKRFDYDSVKSRLIERLRQNSDAATILDDGAFSNLLDVFSEGVSEVARYLEYNTLEKKWTTAQNMSSLTSMGSLIGRKRERPKSAMGYVVVSHTDDNGKKRLQNFGNTFFDIDELSDFDDREQDTSANYIKQSSLVPWTCTDIYTIPKGTKFTSAAGVSYISTQAVNSRVHSEAYSSILANPTKLENFLASGGWDGLKYLKVPVIQGIERTTELGTANGSRFQTFRLSANNVENASNSVSKEYFYVEVQTSLKAEKWAEIQKIRLAGPYDKVFESKLSEDGEGLLIKFGDGNSGSLPPKGAKIVLHYLETLGSAGNLEQKFQINTLAYPNNEAIIDPRANTVSAFLSCTNTTTIMGGRDVEDEDNYKTNAPTNYLKSYTTAVKSAYEKNIMENSPILLSKIKCYPSSAFKATQYDTSLNFPIKEKVANELSVVSNTLNVTAIKANGTKIEDGEVENFVQTTVKTLGDVKGPNDSITYVEPNFIKIAPSIKVNTYDITITEDEIQQKVSAAVSAEYSIFNTEFNEPFYTSRVSYLTSLFKFTDSVNLNIEALANVDMDEDKILVIPYKANTESNLVAIPFKFDKVYGSNKYKSGFKNYSVGSPYLLKVDLNFINNPTMTTKDRTFFLYDNRKDGADVKLEDAKGMTIDSTKEAGTPNNNISIKSDDLDLNFFDETKDGFENRQVRVAQYPYIDAITDEAYMSKAKSWLTQPFENRPYEQNTTGRNNLLLTRSVDSSLTVGTDGGSADGNYCYKRNPDWIDYVDIIFDENYNDPESQNYATGYVVLPLIYLGLDNTYESVVADSPNVALKSLSLALKNNISLKVYAQPKMEDIEPENVNDIVFVDDDDIKIEKNLKYKD